LADIAGVQLTKSSNRSANASSVPSGYRRNRQQQ
jgi:hypothetical protein